MAAGSPAERDGPNQKSPEVLSGAPRGGASSASSNVSPFDVPPGLVARAARPGDAVCCLACGAPGDGRARRCTAGPGLRSGPRRGSEARPLGRSQNARHDPLGVSSDIGVHRLRARLVSPGGDPEDSTFCVERGTARVSLAQGSTAEELAWPDALRTPCPDAPDLETPPHPPRSVGVAIGPVTQSQIALP